MYVLYMLYVGACYITLDIQFILKTLCDNIYIYSTLRVKMIIYVDLDGVLCSIFDGDYRLSTPYHDNIAKVNALYNDGHTIVIWTARGVTSNSVPKLFDLTRKQLDAWGLKYHELRMNKPHYDIFIDDHAFNTVDEGVSAVAIEE